MKSQKIKGAKVTTTIKGSEVISVESNPNSQRPDPVFDKPTLQTRVKQAKEELKRLNINRPKIEFFDDFFGSQLKSESIRTDNLWSGYISELDFTLKLEEYVAQKQKQNN